MITVDQVRRGLARYMDSEILPKVTGWQRWVLGAGATAYLSKLDKLIEIAKSSKALSMLELIDENGMIDVDMIYNSIRPEAEKQTAYINIPGMGRITLSASDVDKLYQCIIDGRY